MKKSFISVIVLFIVCVTCYAQSSDLKIINNDEQICILASVSDVDIENSIVTVNYSKAVGTTDVPFDKNDELKIRLFSYSYSTEFDGYDNYNTPMQGDNIYIVLKNYKNNICEKAGVAYKVTTVENVETLFVRAPEIMKGDKCMTEVIAYSHLLRSEGKDIISIENDSVIIKNDSSEITVTPKDSYDKTYVVYFDENNQTVDDINKPDVINSGNKTVDTLGNVLSGKSDSNKRAFAFGVIGAGLLFGMIVVYIINNKKSRGI